MRDMFVRSTLFAGLCAVCASAAEINVVEQIVAKVNGDIITRGEIERSRLSLEAEMKRENVPADKMAAILKEREKDFLKEQIDQLLLVQKGKELSISCDPQITRQMAEIQAQVKIADPDKFQQYVREQTGMPFEDYKQQMKNQCLTQGVIRQEVGGRIAIPKEDLLKHYEANKTKFVRQEQVYLREIFLSTTGKTPAQITTVERKAKDLVARARKGEKFHELARDHSESESAKSFGELGWFKKGELLKSLEDVVFAERKNFVTEPIKTDSGFLIVKLEERHEAGQAAFEDVENEIMEALYTPLMLPKMKDYMTKLRQDAFLEIREGYVDTGAAPGKDTAWRDPAQLRPETTTKAEVAANRKRRLLKIIPIPGGKPKAAEDAPTAATGAVPAGAAPVAPK